MVNTGRPSRGCLTCRRRRVKCDETRPECNRCTKLNVDCEWKDEWSSMVRHQETWAQKTVAQRVERVQNRRNERGRQGPFHIRPSTMPSPDTTTLFNPQVVPEIYAIERFYTDYGFRANSCPFLNLVQPLYGSQKTPTCIHSVLPAVALASVAKQLRRYDLMQEAHRYYGRALKTMAKVLTDPVASKHDATLVTVYLMGLYETICFDHQPGMISPWQSHGTGRIAILRLRGPEQLSSQVGRNLFLVIYTEQLIASLLNQSGEVLEEAPAWIQNAFPLRPYVNQVLLMHDVSVTIKKLSDAIKVKHIDQGNFLDTFRLGLELEKEVSELTRTLSEGIPAETPNMHFYKPMGARHNNSPEAKPPQRNSSRVNAKRNPLTSVDDSRAQLHDAVTRTKSNLPKAGSPSHNAAYLHAQAPHPSQTLSNRKGRKVVTHSRQPDPCHEGGTQAPPQKTIITLEFAQKCARKIVTKTSSTLNAEVAMYFSVTYGILSNLCRATEISLLQVLLAALKHIVPGEGNAADIDIDSLRMQWTATIALRAIEISDNVPYALGEVDAEGNQLPYAINGIAYRAYMQLWCMRTALGAPQTPKRYKIILAQRLKSIADEMGIGMAAELLATMKDAEDLVNATQSDADDEGFSMRLPLRPVNRMFYLGLYRDEERGIPLYADQDFKRGV